MSVPSIILLLVGLCISGFFITALSADRGIVPRWLSRPWIWSGITAYVAGIILFIGTWGFALFGYPELFIAFGALVTDWLPQEDPAVVTGLILFGPMAVVPILWGITGNALLPLLGWDLVTRRSRLRRRFA